MEIRAERWPRFEESLLDSDFLLAGGGKAANVTYAARRLGAPACLVGHLGNDLLREVALRALRQVGVDLTGTRVVDGSGTGLAMIVVRKNGDKAIIAASNANDVWTPPDVDEVAALIHDAPDGSLLVADVEIPTFVVVRAVEVARQRGLPVILDPSRTERVPNSLLRQVDYLTPNVSEARQLTGVAIHSVADAIRAGRILVERGVRTVLVKLARGGCVVVGPEGAEHVAIAARRAIDTTGAGDTFAAAFAVALCDGWPVLEAVRFAVVAAQLAVESYGAQTAAPTRPEIEQLLAREYGTGRS